MTTLFVDPGLTTGWAVMLKCPTGAICVLRHGTINMKQFEQGIQTLQGIATAVDGDIVVESYRQRPRKGFGQDPAAPKVVGVLTTYGKRLVQQDPCLKRSGTDAKLNALGWAQAVAGSPTHVKDCLRHAIHYYLTERDAWVTREVTELLG